MLFLVDVGLSGTLKQGFESALCYMSKVVVYEDGFGQ